MHNPKWSGSVRRLLCAAIGLGMLQFGTNASAHDSPTVLLSVRLLRSDAIVFATVATLRGNSDHPDLVDVEISNVASIRSRWDPSKEPLNALRVRGTAVQDAGIWQVSLRGVGKLREGGRYMLMLAGGSWSGTGPFTDGGISVFEVLPSGDVGCGSGYLYGVNREGFVCGNAGSMAGEPLREGSLRAEIEKHLAFAIRARPGLDQRFDRAAQPLSLLPRPSDSRPNHP